MTPRFGIIGDPVTHSKSPALFEAAYGGRYTYELIQGSDFAVSWKTFLDGFTGINITAPFKEQAFRSVDIPSPGALHTGAVNLAIKTARGIEGHNTDIDGVIRSVENALGGAAYPSAPTALIIGCGGAGRAAVVAASSMGYSVTLMNRTFAKAERLSREIKDIPINVLPAGELKSAISSSDLIIYTASGPIEGLDTITASDLSSIPGRPAKMVLEADYRAPSFGEGKSLSKAMKDAGCRYIGGRQWLLWQAVAGYGIFTGEEPDIPAMAGILQ